MYLPQMAPVYVWCTLVPNWGNRGELAPPEGRTILSNVMIIVWPFFTLVPVDYATATVQNKVQQDPLLPHRTSMSISQIIILLEFCLKTTYFLFQGKYFEQVHGAAMGSPISTLTTYLFIKEFKVKAISSASTPSYGSGM